MVNQKQKTVTMLVFSIDPGVVNVGVACYDTETQTVVMADKLSLAPSLKAMENEAEIIPRVYKLFFDETWSPYYRLLQQAQMILVETQMKRKMLLIQHVIGSFCFQKNKNYMFVCPRSVKSHFKTGKHTRKVTGKSVRGAKKNHAANKKMAIHKVNSMFPFFMMSVKTSKQDDVADAILQAVWYANTKVKDTNVSS